MEFIGSLSFEHALLFSGSIAFVLSLVAGLILFRRRRKIGRAETVKPARIKPAPAPAPAVVSTYMAAPAALAPAAPESVPEDEAPGLAARMAEVIDRLEESVGSCLDACARLIEERPRAVAAGLADVCGVAGTGIPERVVAMRRSGAGEDEIAGQLSLDRELVRLYMHVGAKEK